MEQPWSGDLRSKNIWIFGKAGIRKSKWANNLIHPRNIFHKNINKWRDGYQFDNHILVRIEDWPTDKQMFAQIVKVWSDRYNFIGKAKGSHVTIDPGRFFLVITRFSILLVISGGRPAHGKSVPFWQ